jgi:hypothetical protein
LKFNYIFYVNKLCFSLPIYQCFGEDDSRRIDNLDDSSENNTRTNMGEPTMVHCGVLLIWHKLLQESPFDEGLEGSVINFCIKSNLNEETIHVDNDTQDDYLEREFPAFVFHSKLVD